MIARLKTLWRTTTFRLSALYILLFCLCAIGLSAYITNLSVTMLTTQTQNALQEEFNNIRLIYQRNGLPTLMRVMDHRSQRPGAFLYLITDAQGNILFGNVRIDSIDGRFPERDDEDSHIFVYSRYAEQIHSEQQDRALVRFFTLQNGMRVLVGSDLSEPERYLGVVRRAIIWAFVALGFGALLIWFFVGRRAMQRIHQISSASQSIMQGDLSKRLPMSGSGDEFDRLSDNLNRMLSRIEELNSGLREVSDNIAHDLKTPLTRLRNRAEMALQNIDNPEDGRHEIEHIINESDQLIKTFNAILMISRLEAGSTIQQLQPISLNAIIDDAIELYEPVVEEAGMVLEKGELVDANLHLNRELVAQTLFNLIENAIKYAQIPDGKGYIRIYSRREDGFVKLYVCDNGPGIAEQDREKALERFGRLEKSRSQPGFGLGLSLARAVMKLHGGQITLENGQPGLCVVLSFPIKAAKG